MARAKKAGKASKVTSKELSDAYSKFLADGGEVEVIPYNTSKEDAIRNTIGNLNPKVPELMTLPEAADMFGQKSNRKKKEKIVDLSKIDKSLIPASLHGLFSESSDETQKDKESHEADTN